jgi:hypothetical protein
VATGALAWAQGLQLPDPSAAKPKKPAKAPQPAPSKKAGGKASGAAGMMALGDDFSPKLEKYLRKICSDYPRLHGFLQGVAWSPQVLMPNAWIGAAMDMHDRMPNSRSEATATKALHDAVNATMTLCTAWYYRRRQLPALKTRISLIRSGCSHGVSQYQECQGRISP